MRLLLRSARATTAAVSSLFAEQPCPMTLVRAISRQSAHPPIIVENSMYSTVKAPHWKSPFTNTSSNARGLAAASAATGPVTVSVPPMGESISDGEVANLLKQSGDYVHANDVILQIETDKVTIDVVAPVSGTIQNVMVSEGDTVSVDQEVAVITESGEPTKTKPAEKPAAPKEAAAPSPSRPPAGDTAKPLEAVPPVAPQVKDKPVSKPSESSPLERRVPMTRPRRRIATRLKDAQNTYALLTTFNEVDMTGLSSLRKEFSEQFFEKHGAKLGFMSFFVKATVYALQKDPIVNAVIDGDDIIHRDYYDISIAVGTPKGLVVPVIRSAEKKGFSEVEKELGELAKKARNSELSLAEMTGGTFTISNGGVYGSLLSTPILNPPQSAILGMHSIQKRPVVINDEIVIRPMMYLALTYDHRLIDGREAVTFLRNIKAAIEDPRRLLLDL